MGKRPTEEDLGIEPTAEELEVLSRPPAPMEDDGDEVPIDSGEDGDETSHHQVAPEKVDGRKTRAKDPVTGHFLPKDAAPATEAEGQQAPAVEADGRKVDLRALQEERALRRTTEERMNVLLDILNKREAREALAEAPAEPAIPDKTTDPLGYMDYMEQRLGRIEGETRAQQEARQAADREDQEWQQVMQYIQPQLNEAQADPTFAPTYNALLESFARELCFINRIPADANQMTAQQKAFLGAEMTKLERSHIRHAAQTGQAIGDYTRQLAATRGVTLQAPAAQQQAPAQTQQRTIPQRAAAQQRHMSLGDVSGSPAPAQLTAKDIAKMSSKEFAALAKQLGDAGLDKLIGSAGQA